MCIISGEVEVVHKTQILIAPCTDGRVFTVYANAVKFTEKQKQGGAMILPFPGKECALVNLEAYADLFEDLRKPFNPMTFGAMSLSSDPVSDCTDEAKLVVEEVGSYKASIVPALADLNRLRFDVFELDPEVLKLVAEKYPKGYGFVVCQLAQDKEYHPFGYSYQSDNRVNAMMVPTLHIHPGHDEPDWDHEIYTWNCTVSNVRGLGGLSCRAGGVESWLKFEKLPSTICKLSYLNQYKIQGHRIRNLDLLCVVVEEDSFLFQGRNNKI